MNVRCNLAVVLAKQRKTITEVSKNTGLSRTTLTSLCRDKNKAITFEVIGKLCKELEIQPGELFELMGE